MLHRVESWGTTHGPDRRKFVHLSFDTEYNGIWQCEWHKDGLTELNGEPMFHFLKEEEQEAVKQISPIVFYFTHGIEPEAKAISGYDS